MFANVLYRHYTYIVEDLSDLLNGSLIFFIDNITWIIDHVPSENDGSTIVSR